MTIEIASAAVSPWRSAYPVPKDVRLQEGPWCPMDLSTVLICEQRGWVCPACRAYWDRSGRNGRWIADAVLAVDGALVDLDDLAVPSPVVLGHRIDVDRAATIAIVAGAVLGGGFAVGREMREHADAVPEPLLWAAGLTIFGLLALALALVAAWRWWEGRR